MTSFTFYNYAKSSASYRVRIAMGLKGVSPDRVHDVNLRTGDQNEDTYLTVAPSGLVPAVEFGDATLTQSIAIIEWLDGAFPEPRLIPENPRTSLQAREIAYAIACDIHPLNNLRVLKYLTEDLGLSEDQKNQWYAHWIHKGFEGIETRLASHADEGRFALGAAISIADVCLIPQVFNARRFNVDLNTYPRIQAIDAACNELPGFANAKPG